MNIKAIDTHQVVIIGGGYAGTLAALRLAGKTKKSPIKITLINASEFFVERIRLHQLAVGQQLRQYAFNDLLAKTGVDFVQGWVTAVSPTQSTITLQTQTGTQQIAYDSLIYALGSKVANDVIPGIQEHAFTLGNPQIVARLKERLAAMRNGRLLVIGGGLTGIEAATEIAETYPLLHVTLATKGEFGSNFSPRGAAHIRKVFSNLNISMVEGTAVDRIESQKAITDNEEVLEFDICLWAGSFVVPSLARESGLPVDDNGRIRVTPTLQVEGLSNIYAVGDAAATPLRMACATAMPMAAYAADHLSARIQNKAFDQPYRFAFILQCISLGRKQALVQFVNPDDSPRDKIVTGWAGVKIKELICKSTIWGLKLEKRIPGSYWWSTKDIIFPQNKPNSRQELSSEPISSK